MENEVKCNVNPTREKLLHNKPLDLSLQNGLRLSSDDPILKKQNSDDSGCGIRDSDDSGFRESIDDNNSRTKPTDHQPRRHPEHFHTGKPVTNW